MEANDEHSGHPREWPDIKLRDLPLPRDDAISRHQAIGQLGPVAPQVALVSDGASCPLMRMPGTFVIAFHVSRNSARGSRESPVRFTITLFALF